MDDRNQKDTAGLTGSNLEENRNFSAVQDERSQNITNLIELNQEYQYFLKEQLSKLERAYQRNLKLQKLVGSACSTKSKQGYAQALKSASFPVVCLSRKKKEKSELVGSIRDQASGDLGRGVEETVWHGGNLDLNECERVNNGASGDATQHVNREVVWVKRSLNVPYFMDPEGHVPRWNMEFKERQVQDQDYFRSLAPKRKWTEKEHEMLKRGVRQQNQQIFFTKVLEMCKEKGEEGNIDLDAEIERIQNMPELELEKSVDQIEWDVLLASAPFQNRSAKDLMLEWHRSCSPLVNHGPWSSEEDEKLISLAETHRCCNWERISEELGTKRTPISCLMRFVRIHGVGVANVGVMAKKVGPGRGGLSAEAKKSDSDEEYMNLNHEHGKSAGLEPETGSRFDRMTGRFEFDCDASKSDNFQFSAANNHGLFSVCTQSPPVPPQASSPPESLPASSIFSLRPCFSGQKWSTEEDLLLIQAIKKYGVRSWQQVANELCGRVGQQCLHRWNKTLDPSIHRGKWSAREDQLLALAVKAYNPCNWTLVQRHVPGRTDVQCRERWVNVLDPHVSNREWTPMEDEWLRQIVKRIGTGKWAVVAKELTKYANKFRRRSKKEGDGERSSLNQLTTSQRDKASHEPESYSNLPVAVRTDNQCWRRWKYLSREECFSEDSGRKAGPGDLACSSSVGHAHGERRRRKRGRKLLAKDMVTSSPLSNPADCTLSIDPSATSMTTNDRVVTRLDGDGSNEGHYLVPPLTDDRILSPLFTHRGDKVSPETLGSPSIRASIKDRFSSFSNHLRLFFPVWRGPGPAEFSINPCRTDQAKASFPARPLNAQDSFHQSNVPCSNTPSSALSDFVLLPLVLPSSHLLHVYTYLRRTAYHFLQSQGPFFTPSGPDASPSSNRSPPALGPDRDPSFSPCDPLNLADAQFKLFSTWLHSLFLLSRAEQLKRDPTSTSPDVLN